MSPIKRNIIKFGFGKSHNLRISHSQYLEIQIKEKLLHSE